MPVRIAFWIPKAINTHSRYAILIALHGIATYKEINSIISKPKGNKAPGPDSITSELIKEWRIHIEVKDL
jgi:hypothetical protein